MNAELQRLIEQLLDAYRCKRELILLFDYDGTLAPIVDHPRLAVLPLETRQALRRLFCVPRLHLGILSGRHLADLRGIVSIPGLYLAGTSGLEVDFAGVQVRHPAAGRLVPELLRLKKLLAAVLRDFPRAWLETKPVGLTVHFRRVDRESIDLLRDRVARIVGAFEGRFRCLESTLSLEITPNLGWDKGTAVQMIVNSIGSAHAFALYAGDGANDADAFRVVSCLGGISLGIGAESPAGTQFRMERSAQLSELLSLIADSLAVEAESQSFPESRSLPRCLLGVDVSGIVCGSCAAMPL